MKRGNFPAPVAQWIRASGFEPEGRGFESLRAYHTEIELETSPYWWGLFLIFGQVYGQISELNLFSVRVTLPDGSVRTQSSGAN
jgi:hypothetical protein